MKQCIKCNVKLCKDNWYLSCKNKCYYICKKCHQKKNIPFKQSDKGKKYMQKYHQIYNPKYYLKNRERIATRVQKHRQTEKGKIVHRKANRKSASKRKRNLGWIQMFENPFDEAELVDYHHITNAYVVAIPRDLHKLYGGKYHREKVMEIVKQIYLEGINVMR